MRLWTAHNDSSMNYACTNIGTYVLMYIPTGWPDWTNFRPLSDTWLWAGFFNYKSSPHFRLLFSTVKVVTKVVTLTKKLVGLYFGRFFTKRIRSPRIHTNLHDPIFFGSWQGSSSSSWRPRPKDCWSSSSCACEHGNSPANPTIGSYNASVVKIYSATNTKASF
jgi:hypothetical protein